MKDVPNIKILKGGFAKLPVYSEIRIVNSVLIAEVKSYLDMPIETLERMLKPKRSVKRWPHLEN